MAGSGSLVGEGLLGWRSRGGRHFQALAQAHPIVQARAEEEDGGSGGGRMGAGATRVSSRGQRGSGIGVGGAGRDHPLRWQHPPSLITPPEESPSNACVITPQPALLPPRTKAPATPDTCR